MEPQMVHVVSFAQFEWWCPRSKTTKPQKPPKIPTTMNIQQSQTPQRFQSEVVEAVVPFQSRQEKAE
jgi:hypothetical protein